MFAIDVKQLYYYTNELDVLVAKPHLADKYAVDLTEKNNSRLCKATHQLFYANVLQPSFTIINDLRL